MRNLALLIVALVLGCQSHETNLEPTIRFSDEDTFKKALMGTWVLKDYRDSVLCGKRPIGITRLLAGTNRIVYDPTKKFSYAFPEDSSYYVFVDRAYFLDQLGFSIEFDLQSSSVALIKKEMHSTYDLVTQKWVDEFVPAKNVGAMNITLSGNDTLLNVQFFDDSLRSALKKSVDYDVLLNRAFVSGKYLVLDGTKESHYVSFGDDGYVQGLENLSNSLARMDRYHVVMTSFSDHTDQINFSNFRMKLSIAFQWERTNDTLILKDSSPDGNRYVLKRLN